MATIENGSDVALNWLPGFSKNPCAAQYETLDLCRAKLDVLLESAPSEIGRTEIALLNLLCAPTLPGSENLNISKCLARLDRLTAHVRDSIERNFYRFQSDPDYGHCAPMWKMAMLVTVIKCDYGAAYNPAIIAEKDAGGKLAVFDSRDSFIHGLLEENRNHRYGTCASIPVLVVAVARRLGYPVSLAVAGRHIFARWEGDSVRFNIEASNPLGMTVQSDDEYRKQIKWARSTSKEESSSYYIRSLLPAEEFALFLTLRVECLQHAVRYEETLLWSARAMQFAPDDPGFPKLAYYAADLAIKHRVWRKNPKVKIPPNDDPNQPVFNLGELLGREEFSLYLTILAHYHESLGQMEFARQLHEDACRHNFHGNNEHRDLQRFIRKYGSAPKPLPLVFPKNRAYLRRYKLPCKPHEEADALLRLSLQHELKGQLISARDALHDLYLFDPANTGVFLRARAIEQRAQFQIQLKLAVAQQKSKYSSSVKSER